MSMKPIQQLIESMTDFSCMLEWGSPSYKTWKKNCDASLERSHKRRQRSDESIGWRIGVPILLLMLVLFVVLLWVGILTGEANI